MSTNIYILKLTLNKFYVGKSKYPEKRFLEHLNGEGSAWTTKYEPLEILKVIPNASSFDEDRYVKEYMALYGIDNVRGGSYVKETLEEIEKYTIKKEIWSSNDCCLKCGRKDHFVKDCNTNTDIDGDPILNIKKECDKVKIQNCFKCGKTGHYAATCYVNNVNCYKCGRNGHYASNCYARKYSKKYYYNSYSDSD